MAPRGGGARPRGGRGHSPAAGGRPGGAVPPERPPRDQAQDRMAAPAEVARVPLPDGRDSPARRLGEGLPRPPARRPRPWARADRLRANARTPGDAGEDPRVRGLPPPGGAPSRGTT